MLSLLLPLAAGVSAEPACLLQKPKAPTQLSLLAETPVAGWEYAGKGDCNLPLGSILRPDPMSCASWCATDHPSAIAFSFGGLCDCCEGLVLNTGSSGFAYARAVPSWQFLGVGKFCGTPALSLPSTPLPPSLNDCAASCGINQWMLYVGTGATGAPATCDCCATEFLIDSAIPEQFVYYSKLPGWVYAGLGACDPTTISTQLPLSGPNECADHCRTQAAPGFSYDVGSRECHCCFGVRVQTNPDPTVTPYVYVLADPFWRFFAADQKCVNPVRTSFHTTLAGCAKTCEPPDGTWKWLVYGYNNEQDRCDCCNDAGLEAVPPGGNGGLLSLGPYGGLGYQLDPLTFPDVPGWSFGGRRMDCDGAPVATTLGSPSPSSCAAFCAPKLSGSFVIDPNFPTSTAATCKCCGILQQEAGVDEI